MKKIKKQLVKCPECNEMIDKESSIHYKTRYFHPRCLETKKSRVDEEPDRKMLIDYIMKVYKLQTISPFILKQIKNLREEGYTYRGMLSTLRYFYEIKENKIVAEGIGIVPFVYEEAKKWYIQKSNAHKHNDELIATGQVFLSPRIIKPISKHLDIQIIKKINISEL